MKKYRMVIIIVALLVAINITVVVLNTRYIIIHKDDLIYQYMLSHEQNSDTRNNGNKRSWQENLSPKKLKKYRKTVSL